MADTLQEEQRSPYSPIPTGLTQATGLIIAPQTVQERLRHFPEEVYDTSPSTHLYRFMAALVGDAGAGQLKKRLLMARLASTVHGTHFYDLDRFFGALLNFNRSVSELLEADPYLEPHDGQEWLQMAMKDASFRSRAEQFARAVQFGPTAIGMELIAEAMLNIDVEIFESYEEADIPYRSWGQVEGLGTYGDLEAFRYGQLEVLN